MCRRPHPNRVPFRRANIWDALMFVQKSRSRSRHPQKIAPFIDFQSKNTSPRLSSALGRGSIATWFLKSCSRSRHPQKITVFYRLSIKSNWEEVRLLLRAWLQGLFPRIQCGVLIVRCAVARAPTACPSVAQTFGTRSCSFKNRALAQDILKKSPLLSIFNPKIQALAFQVLLVGGSIATWFLKSCSRSRHPQKITVFFIDFRSKRYKPSPLKCSW